MASAQAVTVKLFLIGHDQDNYFIASLKNLEA
jgi:hypothetical protein